MEASSAVATPVPQGASHRPGLSVQLRLLCRRRLTAYWRDTEYNVYRLLVVVGFLVFVGAVYQGIGSAPRDFPSIQVLRGWWGGGGGLVGRVVGGVVG